MLQSINQIKLNTIKFKVNNGSILNLDRITNVKAYIQNFNIIVIFEIPLVEQNVYQYYQLYAFPTKINTYLMILPTKKYHALNEHNYIHIF